MNASSETQQGVDDEEEPAQRPEIVCHLAYTHVPPKSSVRYVQGGCDDGNYSNSLNRDERNNLKIMYLSWHIWTLRTRGISSDNRSSPPSPLDHRVNIHIGSTLSTSRVMTSREDIRAALVRCLQEALPSYTSVGYPSVLEPNSGQGLWADATLPYNLRLADSVGPLALVYRERHSRRG